MHLEEIFVALRDCRLCPRLKEITVLGFSPILGRLLVYAREFALPINRTAADRVGDQGRGLVEQGAGAGRSTLDLMILDGSVGVVDETSQSAFMNM